MVRILLVDEQKRLRKYLHALLDPDCDLEVIATIQKGKSAIEQVASLQPDIVLIDIDTLGIDGVQATKTICQRFPQIKVLVLSSNDRDEYIHQALDAGAIGYLIKNVCAEELRETIRFFCQDSIKLEHKLPQQSNLKIPVSTSVSANSVFKESGLKIPVVEKELNLSANSSQFQSFRKFIPPPSNQKEMTSLSNQPSPKQISWYQLLTLLMIAVGCTTGIYLLRQALRKPLPSLNYIQQQSTLMGTEFSGKVKPAKIVKIAASIPSVVEKINVQIGDKVNLDQPLIVLKNPESDREIEQILQQRQNLLQQEQAVLQQQQTAKQKVLIWEQKITDINRQETPLAAKIADADLELSLTQSEADKLPLPQRQDSVERTKAIYERAESRVRRFAQLYQQGAIAQDQLEQAQADLKVAKADYQVAETAAATANNLELAKKQKSQLQRQVSLEQQKLKRQELEQQLQNLRLESQQATERLKLIREQSTQLFQRQMPSGNTIVKATSAGVVVQVPVKIGDQIFTGNPLLELAQLKSLNVEVLVNARLINALRQGQKATIKVGIGKTAQKFEGKIVTINPIPSENMNHTVEIQFENPDDALLVGQMAAIQFLPD
ncbi:response regulator [Calothrix sp. NIES-2100]|uniref:response regulator n=1 Tax=Calothrix sp. NIES-2100 TaxID=1954172 RepID=UPI000B60B853|nr:response regulator [Calothrix sp. NIES-2100]